MKHRHALAAAFVHADQDPIVDSDPAAMGRRKLSRNPRGHDLEDAQGWNGGQVSSCGKAGAACHAAVTHRGEHLSLFAEGTRCAD